MKDTIVQIVCFVGLVSCGASITSLAYSLYLGMVKDSVSAQDMNESWFFWKIGTATGLFAYALSLAVEATR